MKRKINLRLTFIGIVATLVTACLVTFAFNEVFRDRLWEELQDMTTVLQKTDLTMDFTQEELKKDNSRYRVTLIKEDGTVLFDSVANVTKMSNHKDRQEVKQALRTGTGKVVRNSDTLGKNTYYYAVKIKDGNILRVAMDAENTTSVFVRVLPFIIIITIVIIILCFILSTQLTRGIVRPIERMAENPENVPYEELYPFTERIEQQKREIRAQVRNLALEQNKVGAIIENMSEVLILLDMNKKILMVNSSAVELFHAPANVEGQTVHHLTRDKSLITLIERGIQGEDIQLETKLMDREYHVIINSVNYKDKSIGILCMLLDITEKAHIDRMKQEFTANVSHELKTPLTSILGYAELMENGMVKESDIVNFSGKIHTEAGRLITLIGDIMQLSELESLPTKYEFVQCDLKNIVEEVISSLELKAQQKNIDLHLSGEGAVYGEQRLLTEIVYNLCDNAIRYNENGGQVYVTIEDDKTTCRLSVADTGIGIAKEHQDRVFERFYRVDKSRSKATGGTGLGLAIVKHIAEQHGAKIEISSQMGVGTTITIIFYKHFT